MKKIKEREKREVEARRQVKENISSKDQMPTSKPILIKV